MVNGSEWIEEEVGIDSMIIFYIHTKRRYSKICYKIQTKQNNLHSESNHYVNFMGILNELFYELKLNAKFSYISLTSSITSDNPANTM